MVEPSTTSVLFTDIVGSTALAMVHSPEEADQIRRSHFELLRGVIDAHGGIEVKNLGDGVMAVFSSASRCVAAAVAMQQAVDLENRRHTHSVGLRVGVSGGDVSREDDDYFGDPIVEAARLCAACERGEILISEVVRLMAGRRNRHASTALGARTLKGLLYEVEVRRVDWEPLDESGTPIGVPLPGRIAARPSVGFIGRRAELDLLSSACTRASTTGQREIVVVSGEAGLGKTTLVAEAARQAFDNGADVLFGHCEEDIARPYQLFAEALGHFVAHAPDELLEKHVAAHGAELIPLVPGLARRVGELPPRLATDAESERFLLFAAVVGLISEASNDHPIVLVLDDLQWADTGSLQLLRHLASAEQHLRVTVIGTVRDSELSATHPFLDTLASLHRQPAVSQIDLEGLTNDEVLAFMAATAGYELEGDAVQLARAVHAETDGNPFFVRELLTHLAESGAIVQDEHGHWTSTVDIDQLSLPDSIRVVITARLGRLGTAAVRTLSVASVIGRDFDLDLLAEATNTSELELLEVLDEARAASLVNELTDGPGNYQFSHALVQHALYQDLGPTRQAATHRAVAIALESVTGSSGVRINELARHWGLTGRTTDAPKAIEFGRLAGDAALKSLAPAEALGHFEQAATRLNEVAAANEVLAIDIAIGLGTAQQQTGDPGFRETLLDAARRAAVIDDNDRLVTAVLANTRGWYSSSGDVDDDKIELLELALRRVTPGSREQALLLGKLCSEMAFVDSVDERLRVANEAVAAADALADTEVLVRVLNDTVYPLMVPWLLDQSMAWSERALRLAAQVGDPVLHFNVAVSRATLASRAFDFDEMDRAYAIVGELATRLDQPSLNWEYTFHIAKRRLMAGDTDEAELLATQALTLGLESGQPDATTFYGAQLAAVSYQRGTMGDLTPIVEQMMIDSPGLQSLPGVLACTYVAGGRVDDARQLLEQFVANGSVLRDDTTWMNGMCEWAITAHAVGDPELVAPIYDQLAPYAGQFATAGGVTIAGPVDSFLGALATVLGRFDEATERLAASRTASHRAGAKFAAAEADLLYAEMLTVRRGPGDLEQARTIVDRARAAASEFGYAGLGTRIEAVLAQLG